MVQLRVLADAHSRRARSSGARLRRSSRGSRAASRASPASSTTAKRGCAAAGRGFGRRHEDQLDRSGRRVIARDAHAGAVGGERARELSRRRGRRRSSSRAPNGSSTAASSARIRCERAPASDAVASDLRARRDRRRSDRSRRPCAALRTAGVLRRRAAPRNAPAARPAATRCFAIARGVRVLPLLVAARREAELREARDRALARRLEPARLARARAAAVAAKSSVQWRSGDASLMRSPRLLQSSRSPCPRARAPATCRRSSRCGRRRARARDPARCARAAAGSA